MKTFCLTAALLVSAAITGQSASDGTNDVSTQMQTAAYAVTERGPHHRTLESISREATGPDAAVPQVRGYTELATGLNFWDPAASEWKESREEIESYRDGAIARQGQHKVIFANDLAVAGAIDMQTPDGKRLRSHILGLGYFDPATGQSVLIAEVTNCIGQILPPNQVVYENAFTDFAADVRYTYSRAGFEQDVILREQPPAPEAYGLDSATAVLQVLTEFLSPPQPTIKTDASDGLTDERLDFGVTRMGKGRAFLIEGDPAEVRVAKQWLRLENRYFLVESVRIARVADRLDQLPARQHATLTPVKGSVRHVVSTKRLLPEPKLAKAAQGEMRVAKLTMPTRGFVLDYVTLSLNTNAFTFQQNETYFITGPVNISGATTIRSNAVIKFAANAGAKLSVDVVTCETTAHQPAIFTARDDDRFGEVITNSTGTPSGYYAETALEVNHDGVTTLEHLRIFHAGTGVYFYRTLCDEDDDTVWLRHLEILGCGTGVYADSPYGQCDGDDMIRFQNGLVSDVGTAFSGYFWQGIIENTTVEDCGLLADDGGFVDNVIRFTNSVLANISENASWGVLVDGDRNGFYNTDSFGSSAYTETSWPFQTGPLGDHYQATSGAFINAGDGLAPAFGLYHFTTQTNQVKEASTTVDLGYHYLALDSGGNPVDTDGDGVPDYLEDANGNGLVDAGEASWLLNSFNGLSFGDGLRVFTPLK